MFHPTIYLQGRSVVVSGRVYVFGKTSAVDATIPTQNIVMKQDSTVFLHHVKTWGWRRYQTTYQSMATERKLNYLPFALLNTPHFMARRGNRHVSSPSPKKYLWVVFGIECPANPYMFSIQWDLMYLDRWTEGTVATKASLSLEYSSLPPALLTTCFLSSSEMEEVFFKVPKKLSWCLQSGFHSQPTSCIGHGRSYHRRPSLAHADAWTTCRTPSTSWRYAWTQEVRARPISAAGGSPLRLGTLMKKDQGFRWRPMLGLVLQPHVESNMVCLPKKSLGQAIWNLTFTCWWTNSHCGRSENW